MIGCNNNGTADVSAGTPHARAITIHAVLLNFKQRWEDVFYALFELSPGQGKGFLKKFTQQVDFVAGVLQFFPGGFQFLPGGFHIP